MINLRLVDSLDRWMDENRRFDVAGDQREIFSDLNILHKKYSFDINCFK